MTTIHAVTATRPVRAPLRGSRSAGLRPVELRLTRRGRMVVLAVGLVVVFVAGLLLSGVSQASDESVGFPTRVVMVAPGDTLWEIADDAAGADSTREMVGTIERLNHLDGGGLQAGQRLVVPLR